MLNMCLRRFLMVKVYEIGEVYFDGKTPVPSYEEWQSYDKCADMLIDVNKKWLKTIVENKKLKKKLAIATKALKDVAYLYIYTDKDLSTVANNALK